MGPLRAGTGHHQIKGNILFELDGQSASASTKSIWRTRKSLPATGLLFPLSIRTKTGEEGIVRTILSVSEENQSMTFAGHPQGAYARLMKAASIGS